MELITFLGEKLMVLSGLLQSREKVFLLTFFARQRTRLRYDPAAQQATRLAPARWRAAVSNSARAA